MYWLSYELAEILDIISICKSKNAVLQHMIIHIIYLVFYNRLIVY